MPATREEPRRPRSRIRLPQKVWDGYHYVLHSRVNGRTYVVCKFQKSARCGGRGIIHDGRFYLRKVHCCNEPDPVAREVEMFTDALKDAMKFPLRLARKQYDELALQHRRAAIRLPYIKVKPSMNRWKAAWLSSKVVGRKKFATLKDFHNSLASEEMAEHLKYDAGKMSSTIIETPAGVTCVVLWDKNFVRQFRHAPVLHIDATFKVFPKFQQGHSKKKQLLVVLGSFYGCVFPLIWVLMEDRKEQTYTEVFKVIFEPFGDYSGRIMMDFETAMRNAVKATLPSGVVLGCLFHFAQAIYKRAVNLGIFITCRDEDSRMPVRLLVALAMLPPDRVREGFDEIRRNIEPALRDIYEPLFEYFERYWLGVRGIADFCVYKEITRTNNAAESNNNRLGNRMKKRPAPMTFLVQIFDIIRITEIEFQTAKRGNLVTRRAVSHWLNHVSLLNAWERLEERTIDINTFLLRAAAAVRKYPPTEVTAEDNDLAGGDEGDEEEEVEEEEEEDVHELANSANSDGDASDEPAEIVVNGPPTIYKLVPVPRSTCLLLSEDIRRRRKNRQQAPNKANNKE